MNFKKRINEIRHASKLQREFGSRFAARFLFYKYTHNTKKYIENAKNVLSTYIDYDHQEITAKEMPPVVPIWVFWWQGKSEMPEIVKICYSSLRRNLPDRTKLILLTKENYKYYSEIPEEIVRKVEKGIFSITLFSDLLRNNLLSSHGGLWVDATIYCSKPIEDEFLHDNKFWSIKLYPDINDKLSIGRNITNRMWGGFIQKSAPGERINTAVFNALKKYMLEHDVLAEYFIQNIFIRSLYDSVPEIKKTIDDIPYSNSHLYDLARIINEPFLKDQWNQMIADTTFFKLSWKKTYRSECENGNDTYYGYISALNTR